MLLSSRQVRIQQRLVRTAWRGTCADRRLSFCKSVLALPDRRPPIPRKQWELDLAWPRRNYPQPPIPSLRTCLRGTEWRSFDQQDEECRLDRLRGQANKGLSTISFWLTQQATRMITCLDNFVHTRVGQNSGSLQEEVAMTCRMSLRRPSMVTREGPFYTQPPDEKINLGKRASPGTVPSSSPRLSPRSHSSPLRSVGCSRRQSICWRVRPKRVPLPPGRTCLRWLQGDTQAVHGPPD